MDKTFDEAIAGIRKAERGVEVREDIAQGMEYVEQFANTAIEKASEAASSAAKAKKASQDTEAAKETAVQKAAAAAGSASNAAESEKNAKASETESAKNLQGTKKYFEQVRTITIGAQGWYATPEALKTAVPVGENGWWAVVGTTDTIWTWDGDTGAWVDTRKEVDLSDYLTQDQIRKLLERYMPLRPATATTLGGVKVGSGLKVTADGKLSADALAAYAAYPVGSIYQSTDPTSPAALFGGTWEQIASERVLMGASSSHAAGTTAEAGLPNITGSFVADVKKGKREVSGAFTTGSAIATTGEYSNSSDVYKFSLDASKSNAIYGRSSTVQPAAYYVHIWKRVA